MLKIAYLTQLPTFISSELVKYLRDVKAMTAANTTDISH